MCGSLTRRSIVLIGEAGTPAPPVRVGTCTYAAWGGSGHSQRVCDDSADDEVEDVERLRRATAPVFRVNRDVVVLNNGLARIA